MSEITKIDQYDLESWNKVHAYLESRTYPAEDVTMDFTSADFVEDGLHLTGMVGVFVPVNVYRKDEPPSPEALDLQRPSEQVVKVGQTFMSCMYDASVRKSLGGLGGCQEFDLNDFPAEFHDLILAYINEEMCSVEAVFIAMRRADEGPGGQLAALQTLIPHVLHYATLPHAHSGAYRDAADALALVAKATGEQA